MSTIQDATRSTFVPNGTESDQPDAAQQKDDIPDIVVRRLPLYVRALKDLSARGIPSVSSESLAEAIGVTAAQIRRDLS